MEFEEGPSLVRWKNLKIIGWARNGAQETGTIHNIGKWGKAHKTESYRIHG